jgi:signal transduction histidine kinase
LHQIIDEGEQLNRLVSDLLDSAHLATGKMTLMLASCDVNALCAAIVEEHRPTIQAAVKLTADFTTNLPPVQGDEMRLRQIVSNLVANAVKYTTQGEITVRTRLRDHSVLIEVHDTGIGIAESQQALVFVPFVQLDNRRMGVGLGLDIALRLAKLHGGDIHLESVPGQGSTFTVELPITARL